VVASCRFVGIFAPSWYVFCHDLRKSGQAMLIRATVSVQNACDGPFISSRESFYTHEGKIVDFALEDISPPPKITHTVAACGP